MKPKDTFVIEYAFRNGDPIQDYREFELESSLIDHSLLFLVNKDGNHIEHLTISLN